MTTEVTWSKTYLEWIENNTAFVSVPFTWMLPDAWSRCVALKSEGYKVRAGGPAVTLSTIYKDKLPDFSQVAELGGKVDALVHHNPDAVFTSYGCQRHCPFCIEGILKIPHVELTEFVPKRFVCDSNLLMCSRKHFDRVIDSLKSLHGIDFNQGLDARLLTDYHVDRIRELDLECVRFAWDDMASEDAVHDAIFKCIDAGIPKDKIRCYVLVGFNDDPLDARCRCETLKAAGIVKPNVQRYQPLDCTVKDSFVGENWTEKELSFFCWFWNRQAWLGGVDYEDYER